MGIVVFAILAVIAYVAYQLGKYDPQIRGAKGERRVADILRRLPEDEYKVLNNLLVQSRFGTTQIDHVVVINVKINMPKNSHINMYNLSC